jgi:RNA recognition motif-containing protein
MRLSAELPLAGSRRDTTWWDAQYRDATSFVFPFFGDRTSLFLLVYQWTDSNSRALQEYFGQTIGPVKRVDLSYALGGKSKGIATVVFTKPAAAAQAAKELDGLKVDTKPMKASRSPLFSYCSWLTQKTD